MINLEILQDSVLAKGEYIYRLDNESERREGKSLWNEILR